MSGGIEIRGARFTIPTLVTGVAAAEAGQRLALAVGICSGADRRGDDTIAYEPDGLDLGLLRAGNMPLLIEHRLSLDYLIGGVLDAWQEGAELRALVRFAEGGEAERLWSLLCQGFSLGLSAGFDILDAEEAGPSPYGGRAYRVTRWRLTEVSVVALGQVERAHVRLLGRDESLSEMAARIRPAERAAKLAVRRRLHLNRWERWAVTAAATIAEELGVDHARLGAALAREVARHGEVLERDLAVPVTSAGRDIAA